MKYGISLPRVKSLPASPSQLAKKRKAKAGHGDRKPDKKY